jgi:putative FmdB family regulatory protein
MPLYEYECRACHHRFERIQKFSDPLVRKCPKCGRRKVEKLLSAPAVQFKGTGWYVTDYGRKGTASSLPDHGEGGKKDGGAEGTGSKESGAEKKPGGPPGARKGGKKG